MSVEIPEKMIVVRGSVCESLPLFDVVGEQGLVNVRLGIFLYFLQMGFKIFDQMSVEFFSQKMGCSSRCQPFNSALSRRPVKDGGKETKLRTTTTSTLVVAKCACANSLLCSAEVVDGCVKAHVILHIHALSEMVHDLIDTFFKELPSVVTQSVTYIIT